jgi:hypothetical protein
VREQPERLWPWRLLQIDFELVLRRIETAALIGHL